MEEGEGGGGSRSVVGGGGGGEGERDGGREGERERAGEGMERERGGGERERRGAHAGEKEREGGVGMVGGAEREVEAVESEIQRGRADIALFHFLALLERRGSAVCNHEITRYICVLVLLYICVLNVGSASLFFIYFFPLIGEAVRSAITRLPGICV